MFPLAEGCAWVHPWAIYRLLTSYFYFYLNRLSETESWAFHRKRPKGSGPRREYLREAMDHLREDLRCFEAQRFRRRRGRNGRQ